MKTELIIITGMSGSGKSVALHALEDSGYNCIDNLPPELIQPFLTLKTTSGIDKLAIAVDVRSGHALTQLPLLLHMLENDAIEPRLIFLDADDQTLVRRFSETRRRHPLSTSSAAAGRASLMEAIGHERKLLGDLRERSHTIDTSTLRAAQLLDYVKAIVAVPTGQLTLVFESFGFKRGLTLDADYVFDVRMLPNPYYHSDLRPLTGRDAPVAEYLAAKPDVLQMLEQIEQFVRNWLPAMVRNHRSYVTVAIGCTGGQHRSVYLVEQLTARFSKDWQTIKRHRELSILAP